MGFGQVGLRPLGRMVGVRVIEADDVFAALAAFALNADQFLGIDVVAVVGESVRVLPARAIEVTVRTPSSSIWPSSTPQHSCG